MIHRKNHHFLRGPCSTKMRGTCLCHSLGQVEFTRYREQVVNRLKAPQGLSTLIFGRWSEVFSRGLVRGDSRRKNDLLHKDATYMSVSQLRVAVSYTHLRAHETVVYLVCRLLVIENKS